MKWLTKLLGKSNRGLYMWCASGRLFYPLDPRADEVHINDIAKGLANECRFAGQCDFYSVAEHSILVSQMAEKHAIGKGWLEHDVHSAALWGLLHDAPEAYIGDVIRPLKYTSRFVGFREIERKIDTVIREHFRPWLTIPSYVEDLVTKLDTRILADESMSLMPHVEQAYIDVHFGSCLGVQIYNLPPFFAEEMYLNRFRELVSDYA